MLTILLLAIPFLAAGIIFLAGQKMAKQIALLGGLATLAGTLVAIYISHQGDTTGLLTFQQDWIGPLGISYAFSLDGISLAMMLLTSITLPLIVYASYKKVYKNAHVFYGLMMLMIGSMIGAFTTTDALLFYIFYEFALIPIYFMCMIWGHGDDRYRITMKFFIYTIFGSLFMLVALLYIHSVSGSFALTAMYEAANAMSATEQGWLFAAFFVAFAVKIPVFPFHTWQPSTYNAAPVAGTMLLGGIMLKMATYGLIRLVLPMLPEGVSEYGSWALGLCAISVVYASCLAIVQKKFKLLLAYSSMAHVGLLAAGILSGNAQGIQGGIVEMISHGIVTVGLFFVYDIIESRMGHDDISKMGGIRAVNPLFAFLFFAIVMASVALPTTSGFVGEFLLLVGLYQYSPILTVIAGLTVVLGAVYMLRSFQSMMLGGANSATSGFAALTTHEKTVLAIIIVLIIALGIYPSPLLELSGPSVDNLLLGIH
ncbi:MAG: NuoM family protein [Flavobacteriales bacterium]